MLEEKLGLGKSSSREMALQERELAEKEAERLRNCETATQGVKGQDVGGLTGGSLTQTYA